MQDIYTENILNYSRNNSFDLNNSDVSDYIIGHGTNPSCGDVGDIYFLLEDRKIKDIRLKREGCAISQAGLVMLSEKLIGKSLEDLRKIVPGDIYNMLGVNISPGRAGCALLCYNAMENFLKK
jgi:NifU-like protein involved in Fe-S cluster formation